MAVIGMLKTDSKMLEDKSQLSVTTEENVSRRKRSSSLKSKKSEKRCNLFIFKYIFMFYILTEVLYLPSVA